MRLPGELKPLPISDAVSVLSLLAAHGDVLNLVSILRGLVMSARKVPDTEDACKITFDSGVLPSSTLITGLSWLVAEDSAEVCVVSIGSPLTSGSDFTSLASTFTVSSSLQLLDAVDLHNSGGTGVAVVVVFSVVVGKECADDEEEDAPLISCVEEETSDVVSPATGVVKLVVNIVCAGAEVDKVREVDEELPFRMEDG